MPPFINATKKFLQSEVDLYLLEDWGHWIFFCFSLLVSSILVFSSLNFGGICLLFVLSFSSINLLSILVHELGHVIAAQALGLKVWKISLGDGLLLFDKRVLGIRLIIRGTPRTGFVEARIPNISFLRLRLIIFSFGGALGNLCLFFAVLKYYQHFSNFLFVFLVTAFMTANMLVWNLVPNRVWMSEGIVENDGLQIIQTIFKSKHELIEEKLASQIRYASEQAKYEQQKINQTQKRRDGSQKSRNTLLFWELLFEDIDFHDYLDYCQRVLERKDISIDQRNETLDTFVTIVLLQGANEYLEAADQ